MSQRRGLVVALLLTSLMANACAGGGSEETPELTESEDAPDGTAADTGDVAAGADSRSPDQLAEIYAVPVPAGMRVVSAGEDAGTGTATFELAYDGDPDVDAYRTAIAQAGWTVDSEGPLASYGWCLRRRLADVAVEIFDRLGLPAGPLIAYALLISGRVQWQVGDSDHECVVGEGLSGPRE